jgi:ParB-like chromosome segregation protein Spo0J
MQLPCTNPVEMWPIERPQPNPDNARIHSDDQVRQIAQSVETHQLNHVIQVDENDMILSGHGLLLALRHLGHPEVPVQVLSHLTEAQKQTYMIADNQIAANSYWDEEKLGLTLQKLERDLINLEIIGFSPQEPSSFNRRSPTSSTYRNTIRGWYMGIHWLSSPIGILIRDFFGMVRESIGD